MKTTKELLKSYYLPGPFQIMKNKMLAEDLERASVDPCIRFVNYLMKKDGNTFHPDDLVRVLARLGVLTENDLVDFYAFMLAHGVEYFMDIVDKRLEIDLESLTIIDMVTLGNRVDNMTNITPFMSDSLYYVVTDEAVKTIIDNINFDDLRYEIDRRDCDDFSVMFKSELSKAGLGNLTVGIIEANGFDGQSDVPFFAHSFIVFFKKDSMICYDPKTRFLGTVHEVMSRDKMCVYAEIRSINF